MMIARSSDWTFRLCLLVGRLLIVFAATLPHAVAQGAPETGLEAEAGSKDKKESDAEKGEKQKGEKQGDGEGAKDAGQKDLDEAVLQRIDAESPSQLQAVATLLESALAKGLDDENESFAKKMLGSVQFQLGQGLASAMMQSGGQRQLQLRDQALDALNRAVENDPTLVKAYLLIARLNLLPNGDKGKIVEAATKAIELLDDDPSERSKVLVLRALARDSGPKKLKDLDAAVEADKENVEALQARAALRLQAGEVDGAIEDLQNVLTRDPSNQAIAQAAVQQLVELNRSEDALALLSKTIEAKPSEALYRLRAILYRMNGKEEEALADLNKALAMQPKDPVALLQRAEIAIFNGDIKSAKSDLRSAVRLAPQVADATQAIYVRCLIANEEGRTSDAINDMKKLVEREPDNLGRRFQLANLYQVDKRPRKAIETFTQILEQKPGNVLALRSRADARLAVGAHAEAIRDYERALEAADEDDPQELSGVLNNLAWVLSTSPEDELRDGERALELGERAAKLTDYKEAHILSTLAACYAEVGDFENAVRWSEKSVELARAEEHAQLEQLEKELESFRDGKPWREKQETPENDVPILAPEDLIET